MAGALPSRRGRCGLRDRDDPAAGGVVHRQPPAGDRRRVLRPLPGPAAARAAGPRPAADPRLPRDDPALCGAVCRDPARRARLGPARADPWALRAGPVCRLPGSHVLDVDAEQRLCRGDRCRRPGRHPRRRGDPPDPLQRWNLRHELSARSAQHPGVLGGPASPQDLRHPPRPAGARDRPHHAHSAQRRPGRPRPLDALPAPHGRLARPAERTCSGSPETQPRPDAPYPTTNERRRTRWSQFRTPPWISCPCGGSR